MDQGSVHAESRSILHAVSWIGYHCTRRFLLWCSRCPRKHQLAKGQLRSKSFQLRWWWLWCIPAPSPPPHPHPIKYLFVWTQNTSPPQAHPPSLCVHRYSGFCVGSWSRFCVRSWSWPCAQMISVPCGLHSQASPRSFFELWAALAVWSLGRVWQTKLEVLARRASLLWLSLPWRGCSFHGDQTRWELRGPELRERSGMSFFQHTLFLSSEMDSIFDRFVWRPGFANRCTSTARSKLSWGSVWFHHY